ncbi:uncharacterized protein PITG_18931 [Phytophthora infestans T30-4]|uniref:Uncharacterized protein n=1 Tax=Phytophthora infestans (strain T30-4) TaxID=403677 RepID=D0P017_PHYIT|nr:uncharacterized protein PITG_18931 [Phytophthora infestans T30-4]EEY70177.1 hypothetical protein PITG_18931 [Phytophthora infestans T30-4]|eukprot:XP_002997038.1 hypothetical protein PITG_18931 [Phytophthora infestans T30-4]
MFCQFFFSSEARKLAASCVLTTICCLSRPTWPMATLRHMTFFIWNLMVARTASAFSVSESLDVTRVGNLPALLRPGPNRRGICLMSVSEARKASYFLANFLITFLFLLNFLRSSTHADLHVGARHGGQLERAAETLVFLRVVVLERDLQLDGLVKVTLLALELVTVDGDGLAGREGQDVVHGLRQQLGGE